ncbi:MAG: ComEC/Rec2 family competence protein [Oscillospiraceae bacterium]|jgi:competence protein ComEC|nr:ComEC/Rec2 family competence protein [Oscillospiraceae bacterium]
MRRLAFVCGAFSAAVTLAHYAIPSRLLVLAAAICAVLSLPCLLLPREVRRRATAVAFALALGFLWSATYDAAILAPARGLEGKRVAVTAVVLSYPERAEPNSRFDARLTVGGRSFRAVVYYGGEKPLEPGDKIDFIATLRRADMSLGVETDRFTARGYALRATVSGEVEVTGAQSRLHHLPALFAHAVSAKLAELFSPDLSPFMRALVIGDTGELYGDAALGAALGTTGVSHVVSVSGMHVSFLLGLISLLVRDKRRLAFFALPVLLFFMAAAGFVPSLVRAVIMQLFVLTAPLLNRESDSMTSVLAALAVLLIANPESVGSVGLQLSFVSTLGIVIISTRLHARMTLAAAGTALERVKPLRAIYGFLIASISTTLGALALTTPLTTLYFGYVSLIAPVTNIVTLWAVSYAFCGGAIAGVLGLTANFLGQAAAWLTAPLARFILWAVRVLSRVPLAAVYTSNRYVIAWLAYAYLLLAAYFALRGKGKQLIAPLCAMVAALAVALTFTRAITPQDAMTVTALNAGAGRSLVVTSGFATAVVDCGGTSGSIGGDAADYLLANGLNADALLLTAWDDAHSSGAELLLQRVRVKTLIVPPYDDNDAPELLTIAADAGTEIVTVAGDAQLNLGGATVSLFAAYGDTNSLAVLCSRDGRDALILGGGGTASEFALLDRAELPTLGLIVADSGSSLTANLLGRTVPLAALLSYGADEPPPNAALARLERFGAEVYRTDLHGSITVNLTANTED